MAGKVRFRDGTHASRTGYHGELTIGDWQRLRSAAPSTVPDAALAELANEIILAQADSKRETSYVPSRDQLAQLKALKRLSGDKLRRALFDLDQLTLERIKRADQVAIQAIIDRGGVFVDVDGTQYHYPPSIQVVRPREPRRGNTAAGVIWLPRGLDSLSDALATAILELEQQRDVSGRNEKPWLVALAKAVVGLWKDHCQTERQSAHHKSLTGKSSPIVEFADATFSVAGFRLSRSRLAGLLQAHLAE